MTIRNDLRSLGIAVERGGLTPVQKRWATQMRRSGRTLRDITAARRFGIAPRTLRSAFEREIMRGERLDGVGSRGVVFLFDDDELAADIAHAGLRL